MAKELRMATFVDFDFRKLKHKIKKIIKESFSEIGDDAVKQLKENITKQTYFKSIPIEESTKAVRRLRNRSGTKPLQDTGKLLKSIKKIKTGISYAAYGKRQNDGFILKPNQSDGSFGFYAPNKSKKNKRLILLKGSSLKVPARPWIVFKVDKKTYKRAYKRISKGLSIKARLVTTNKAIFK